MTMRISTLLLVISSLLFSLQELGAQDLQEARRLAEVGKHEDAEKIYNALLLKFPDHLEALIGAAYNLSWAGRFSDANKKFEAALAIDSLNKSALEGKGYNLAWAKQFEAATYPFTILQRTFPDNIEGRKGLGYVELWKGNGASAREYFSELVLERPRDIEFYIALAQSYLLESKIKKARVALRSALLIDSTNKTVKLLLDKTYSVAAPLELDVWTGYSKVDGEAGFNLRTVQLTAQVGKAVRMYIKYDNSLTLDIASLVRSNQHAQAFSLGSVVSWNKRWTSRLDYGARFLPNDVIQQIFSTEHVWVVSNRVLLKGGGFIGISDKINNEWLFYGSLRLPLSDNYAIEPFYFYSKVEEAPRPENRFMLNNQLRNSKGYELNVGVFYGIPVVPDDYMNKKLYGSYLSALIPINQTIWVQTSLRWEKGPFDELLAIAMGFKLRLER